MHLCAVAAAGGNGKGRRQCLWDKLEATAAVPRPPPPLPPPSRPPTLSPPQPRLLGCRRSIGRHARRRRGWGGCPRLTTLLFESAKSSPRRRAVRNAALCLNAPRRHRRVVFPKRKGIWGDFMYILDSSNSSSFTFWSSQFASNSRSNCTDKNIVDISY